MRTNEFMRSKDLRAEARVSVSQRGTLNSGDTWFPCLIENMSENGNYIMSNRELAVGQIQEFRRELFWGKLLNCKIEVRHVNDTSSGTKIIEIDKMGINPRQLFLQEQYADKLNTFGQALLVAGPINLLDFAQHAIEWLTGRPPEGA